MWRTIGAIALLITLAACSSSDDAESAATTVDPEALAEAQAAAGIPPEPDQATADAYISALDAIDPGIVHRGGGQDEAGDIEAAIDRGRNACSTILDTTGQMSDLDAINGRFTAPDHPEGWGPEIAEQILGVVRQYLCPSP
jgi:hypothetical protein